MLFPSGVQVGAESSKSPSVSCFAGSEPSAGTTNTCARRSPVQPTLSSLNWSRVKRRGSRLRSSSSSYAASRTRETKASRVPSGDQAASLGPSFSSVRQSGSPPSAGIT